MDINMYSPIPDYNNHKEEYQSAINKVLESGLFINGPEIAELEKQLSDRTKSKYSIAVSSGTDALLISLMALDVKVDDEIITVGHTWISTAEVISVIGAKPIFTDVDFNYLMDLNKIEEKITSKTKGIIYVSLYGQFNNHEKLMKIAKNHKLWVIEDAAQSFGCYVIDDNNIINSCNWADISTTSFFPSKPLGAYGDAGACFTNNDLLADKMKAIRNHGGLKRFEHKYIGLNARMDTIQASILLVKLKYFDKALERRREIAEMYNIAFGDMNEIIIPKTDNNCYSAWAQYSLIIIDGKYTRDQIISKLKDKNINTSIFYPIGIHKQICFTERYGSTTLPITDWVCSHIINLPLYPELSNDEIKYIITSIKELYHNTL